ncbi:apolipoprotein N-acyltransferase [Hyphococcus luteus]|uniref:apolipoprotein N-acyltransferase n=1 Tax=Hyphococcus luteus TaxID=2058213 RepID=UPI0013FD5DBF|nr:apolipoprotein N-acyltransferase [Marinicaulis flavus]
MDSFFSRLSGLLAGSAEKLRALKGWRRRLAAFLAGLAGALAMAPVYALPLLAVSLSVFVILIDGAKAHARPRASAFAAGWFWGFGYFLAGVYWMAFSFFVQADQFAWMAPFAMTGMPAFLALFTGVAALVSVPFEKTGWARIALFAAIFAMVEYLRGHILTGLPWNLAGQALAGSAAGSQTAAWYGAYGLSLVAIFLAMAPAAGLGPRDKPHALSGLVVMLAGTAVLYAVGAARLALPDPEGDARNIVRIVQPNIPQREKIDWDYWAKNFERQMEHSRGAVPPDAQLYVIWPENGAPLLEEAATALQAIGDDFPENSVLIAGAVRRARGAEGAERWYNSIAVVEETPRGRAVTAHYDKHHLVPVGEYLPFFEFFKSIGLAALTPYQDRGFYAGAGPKTIEAGGTRFSPMICYEAIFPHASYPAGERPGWLVVVTNDAWYGDTSGPRQHLDMARLRSIETGLPMARSANTGISALIDGKGRMLARLALYQAGKIEAPLPPALPPPLYDRFGDWVFFVMLLGFLAPALAAKPSARK